MGLCRCDKRRVTNLFCFEHRVNVCDFCLISDHSRCVVKSYLRWVKDSDFDPFCAICHDKFDSTLDKECVRLLCLDVFHWDCLDNWVSDLPSTTAPSGFVCPTCGHRIIPPANHGGPIAESLRSFLSDAKWLERVSSVESASDGRPSLFNDSLKTQRYSAGSHITGESGKLLDPKLDLAARQFLSGHDDEEGMVAFNSSSALKSSANVTITSAVQQQTLLAPTLGSAFSTSQRREQQQCPVHVDTQFLSPRSTGDDDKYRRRVALPGLARLCSYSFGSLFMGAPRRLRWRSYLLLLTIFIIVVFFFMGSLNSGGQDAFFDPHMNPNIRVDPALES